MAARKRVLAVLSGGILLGALTGLAVDPVMKPPPEQPWQDRLQKRYIPTPAYHFVEAGPEDLSPALGWRDRDGTEFAEGYGIEPVYEPAVYAEYVYEPLPPLPEYEPTPVETYSEPLYGAGIGAGRYASEPGAARSDRAGRAAAAAREAAQDVIRAAGILEDPPADF